jgi:hypothetical protein
MLVKIKSTRDAINALLHANVPLPVIEKILNREIEVQDIGAVVVKEPFVDCDAEWVLPSECVEIVKQ